MNFSFQTVEQADFIGSVVQRTLFEAVDKAAKENPWIRATALPVAMASCLLRVVIAVASVAETIIKGLGNIFGAAFSEDCSLSDGFADLTFNLAYRIIGVVTEAALGALNIVLIPIKAAIDETHLESKKDEWKEDLQEIQRRWHENELNILPGQPQP